MFLPVKGNVASYPEGQRTDRVAEAVTRVTDPLAEVKGEGLKTMFKPVATQGTLAGDLWITLHESANRAERQIWRCPGPC
jgi:LDH2 family malate/lactate/ureidoglycolate dehydrogenase